MNTAIVIQARMSSHRLPGKVLRVVRGQPLLGYVLERLAHANFNIPIVVATSTDTSDDVIADYCRDKRVDCWRGSLSDVASRFLYIADERKCDTLIRISADSPLLDISIVQQCLERFNQTGCDLATNVFPRTYPRGQSAEVIRASTFRRAYNLMSEPEDFEHVTRYYYRRPESFHIENVRSDVDYGPSHLAVDSTDDLRLIEQVVESMERQHWTYCLAELVELYQQHTCPAETT